MKHKPPAKKKPKALKPTKVAKSRPAGKPVRTQPLDEYRAERRHSSGEGGEDTRSPFERDRDRILYSSYFRRLALITQVVSPDEGYDFHNRLTHVLKVAQIGRRLAEKLESTSAPELIAALGGLEPEVVEAACLAHDLGHPPFGHVAEHVLDQRAQSVMGLEGFEGNAQSFRVLTQLERKYRDCAGLNLTRATLAAVLKYPWLRGTQGKKRRKWGAYPTERLDFEWARKEVAPDEASLEAKLMDWADDIAYSVHDMEDFYRSGRVPLHRLREGIKERDFERLLDGAARRCTLDPATKRKWETQGALILGAFPFTRRYDRSADVDIQLSTFSSTLISRFINGTKIGPGGLSIDDDVRIQVDLLQQLTWQYVIEDPALATQQSGQTRVIETLFDIFYGEVNAEANRFKLFPQRFREQLERADEPEEKIRIVIDLIASMTEQEAVKMFHRLTGVSLGSLFLLDA